MLEVNSIIFVAIQLFPMSVRVRFAPSPTGPLHLGGVRTALYNFLFAHNHGGAFILRIEDTDQNRHVHWAEEYIREALKWCGIIYDEGPDIGGQYGPYRQSERKHIYAEFAAQLIRTGNAYYAFDTAKDIDVLREELKAAESPTLQYDAHTRGKMKNSLTLSADEVSDRISRGESYVIRVKIPADEEVFFFDLIRGEVRVNTNQLDDKVLFKSDGWPTYHLANIVDDHLMKITHVIRGEEWLPSAPLHVLLYKFLGWKNDQPEFAHLPLILRPDGNGKLSKRDGDRLGFPVFPISYSNPDSGETTSGFRERGFFPEAFTNMVALLGWSPIEAKEIFTMQQLIKKFNLQRIHKAGAKFDFEKASWFNHEYMKHKSGEELAAYLQPLLAERGINASPEYITQACEVAKLRSTFVHELWDHSHFFFVQPESFDSSVVKNKWTESARKNIELMKSEIVAAEDFAASSLETLLHNFLQENNFKAGEILPVLRVMLIGSKTGPAVFEIMAVLGKDESIIRMNRAEVVFDKMMAAV
jgi:glutamyl-tRNA synthetase